MAIHLCRDYLTQNTTTANREFIPSYLASIFLRRVLGYTYVGDTNYPINPVGNLLQATGDSTPTAATPTYAAGTRAGVLMNAAIIEVSIPVSTRVTQLADVGRILTLKSSLYPTRNSGLFVITAINQGNAATGLATTIAAGSNGAILPQGTINVASTTNYPTSGTLFIGSNTTVAAGSNGVVMQSTTLTAQSNGVSLPQATIYLASGVNIPASGTNSVTSSNGVQNVTYTGLTNASTTIALASNGATLPTGTIFVASTAGFLGAGSILVVSSNGTQVVNYTSITGGGSPSFNGCTLGTGTLSTGGSVTQVAMTGSAGGSGTLSTGNTVFTPGTINVASTTGFTATGTLSILTSAGLQTITYTGIGATTFTGCSSSTASGTMITGNIITYSAGIQTITYTTIVGNSFQGCTGGSGILTTGEQVFNKNNFQIDYRGNGDVAMTEASDTVGWYLYDKDINCPTNGANNAGVGYRGSGTSTTPRIILQSPHALGWQMRICNETNTDAFTNFNVDLVTFAPGFGGNVAGDFSTGGKHLHGAMFWDTSTFGFNTCTGCGDNAGAGPQHRCTMIGDDGGQALVFMGRRPGNATAPEAFFITFGLPDNEPSPVPLDNTERLYALGNGAANNVGNSRMSQGALSVGSYVSTDRIQGASFHGVPISCSPSLWTYLNPVAQAASPIYDASAGDCPFTSATELTSVDLVVGVVSSWVDGSDNNTIRLPYYPRVIGNLPFVRAGRTNFGDFTLTSDELSWNVSTTTGNGVSPIQITTSTTNNLVTGQIVAVNGVGGNTAANGTFVVTVINNTNFTLNGTTGNGTFTSGGTVYRGASFQHLRFGTYIPWNGPAVLP